MGFCRPRSSEPRKGHRASARPEKFEQGRTIHTSKETDVPQRKLGKEHPRGNEADLRVVSAPESRRSARAGNPPDRPPCLPQPSVLKYRYEGGQRQYRSSSRFAKNAPFLEIPAAFSRFRPLASTIGSADFRFCRPCVAFRGPLGERTPLRTRPRNRGAEFEATGPKTPGPHCFALRQGVSVGKRRKPESLAASPHHEPDQLGHR